MAISVDDFSPTLQDSTVVELPCGKPTLFLTRPKTPGPWWGCPDVWKTCAATCGEAWSRLAGWKPGKSHCVCVQKKSGAPAKDLQNLMLLFIMSPVFVGASWWWLEIVIVFACAPYVGPYWVVDPTGPVFGWITYSQRCAFPKIKDLKTP